MGKIANALGKYAQERKAAGLSKLTRTDWEALLAHNPKTGHLINTNTSANPANHSMDELRNGGTLQRLLDHKLIFPGGKLTTKGLAECKRLRLMKQASKPAVAKETNISGKFSEDIDPDEVIIELKEEVRLPEPPAITESTAKKVVPLIKRPGTVENESLLAVDVSDSYSILPPSEDNNFEGINTTIVSDRNKTDAVVPEMADEIDNRTSGQDFPSITASQVLFDKKKPHRSLVSIANPQSYEAEQFKMLRNNILFPAEGIAPQTILVTSCLPGEGKSFISANLAVSIAMNVNKHVLLIDGDLRKPALQQVFGFGDLPGLSDYLADQRPLDSLLMKTTVEKLTLLPGGPVPVNPSELSSSERMSAMLKEVKERYHDRLIVIDSPPPILAAETSFLARQVDGILIVVKHGKTPREDIEDLMDVVGSDKILGGVIKYLDLPLLKRYGYGKYSQYSVYGNGKK